MFILECILCLQSQGIDFKNIFLNGHSKFIATLHLDLPEILIVMEDIVMLF